MEEDPSLTTPHHTFSPPSPSRRSLLSLQSRIRAAAHSTDGTDGLGGAALSEKMFKAEMWKERSSGGGEDGDWLDVRRFRPNIVLARMEDEEEEEGEGE